MRKLLVASQKGGVGKTTTSISLAAAAAAAGGRVLLLDADPLSNVSTALQLFEHPHRRSLRETGSHVPGILVSELVPGLDVLSPYEDNGCTDDDFENLLRLLALPEIRDSYDCLIVDAPPFLGAKPSQLLATCEEYVLVMRTEPNAYRTLPAFQELVQRSKRGGKAPLMRGILLTLPEGEDPGGRWERELRGRFGSRILPEVIPFDPEAVRARDAVEILVHTISDAPSSVQYAGLVAGLELVGAAKRAANTTEMPVLRAAAAFQANTVVPSESVVGLPEGPPVVLEETALPVPSRRLPVPRKAPPPPEPSEEPDLPMDAGVMMSMPEIPVLRFPMLAANRPGVTLASAAHLKGPEQPKKPAAEKPAAEKPGNNAPPLMWIGAAMIMGFGLRFVQIPPRLVPLVIGVAVAAGMLLLLRLLLTPNEPTNAAVQPRSTSPRRAKESKKAVARPETRKEVNARLSSLTRRPSRPA